MQKKIICHSISDLKTIAEELLNFCKTYRIFAFYGELGIGKTTFIKAICEQLGVEDNVVSPSFSIINEYKTRSKKHRTKNTKNKAKSQNSETIYHFDFYRIKNLNEVYDLGYEDYFYNNSYCFIEWPEKIETLLPPNYVQVIITSFKTENNEKRVIRVCVK